MRYRAKKTSDISRTSLSSFMSVGVEGCIAIGDCDAALDWVYYAENLIDVLAAALVGLAPKEVALPRERRIL